LRRILSGARARRLGLVAVLATSLIAAACGGTATSPVQAPPAPHAAATAPAPATTQLPTVRVAMLTTLALGYVPVYAAVRDGSFDRAGVHVVLIPFHNATTALAAVQSGEAQFLCCGAQVVLLAKERGMGQMAIASLQNDAAYFFAMRNDILTKANVGATSPVAQRLALLRGQTLGTAVRGGVIDAMTRNLVHQAGLTVGSAPGDVHLISMGGGGSEIYAALQNRLIAGFLDSGLHSYSAEVNHVGTIVLTARDLPAWQNVVNEVISAPRSYLQSHAAIARAVARGVAEGDALLHQHPNQAAAAVAPMFKGVPAALLTRALQGIAPSTPANGRMSARGWQRAVALAVQAGQLKSPVSVPSGSVWTDAYLK
jgi:ABC-type nitrate/sulfonate/bicarbonate transport system substrate-binding protein